MFACEYCEIFKNTYFEEELQTAASKICIRGQLLWNKILRVATTVQTRKVPQSLGLPQMKTFFVKWNETKKHWSKKTLLKTRTAAHFNNRC